MSQPLVLSPIGSEKQVSLVAAKSSKLIKVIFVKMVMTDPDPDDDEDALKSVHQWWEKRDPKCIICTESGLPNPATQFGHKFVCK